MKRFLGLDSNSAVTIFSTVAIPRANPRETLSEIDLENYISQAIWKFFDKYRGAAAERLNASEMDLVLHDARVVAIKIDGHQVLNPQGFTGRTVEIVLGGTLTRRDDVEDGTQVFESGAVRAYLLAKQEDKKSLIYVEVGDGITKIFLVAPQYTSYLDEFEWGKSDLVGAVASTLEVPRDLAYAIYLKYAGAETSPKFARVLDKIFDSVFFEFINELTGCLESSSRLFHEDIPPVYVRSFPLPEEIFRKRMNLGKKTAKVSHVPEIKLEEMARDHIYSAYPELNLLAKRRLKWLMPSSL